eukprot:SM000017S02752  [mRNA]  locus=s17:65616:76186:- [translate_table: standard]
MAPESEELPRNAITNLVHNDLAGSLALPCLAVCCGSSEAASPADKYGAPDIKRDLREPELVSQAPGLLRLLQATDISYLSLPGDARVQGDLEIAPGSLIAAILEQDPGIFDRTTGPAKPKVQNKQAGPQSIKQVVEHVPAPLHANAGVERSPQLPRFVPGPVPRSHGSMARPAESAPTRKRKATSITARPEPLSDVDAIDSQNTPRDGLVARFTEKLEDAMELTKRLHSKQLLMATTAIEAAHLCTSVMSTPDMPKQAYNEEILDKVVGLLKHQVVKSVSTPHDYAHRKQAMKNAAGAEEAKDGWSDVEPSEGQLNERKARKSNDRKRVRTSATTNDLFNRLASLVAGVDDVLYFARLQDTTILQLLKLSFSVLQAGGFQVMQMRVIALTCSIFGLYPQHRSSMLDELVALIWRLPLAKRNMRTYPLPDESNKSIQMVSALLLHLVHSSVGTPSSNPASDGNLDVVASRDTSLSPDDNLLEPALEVSTYFWKAILQRCGQVKAPEAFESKAIVENLVRDLLTTLHVPEYPGTGLLLQVLCMLLVGAQGLQAKDIAIRSMAVDFLGAIAARLKMDAVVVCKEASISAGEALPDLNVLAANAESAPSDTEVKEDDHFAVKDKFYNVRLTLLRHLQEASQRDSMRKSAQRFYVLQWKQEEAMSNFEVAQLLHKLQQDCNSMNMKANSVPFSRDSLCQGVQGLDQNSPLAKGIDRILERLLVSAVVEVDPVVLGDERVQRAVGGRFLDSAISAREAATDLVGKHIIGYPTFAIQYFDRVVERIMDTGVSVRKRVIKIIRDICLHQPNFPRKVEACRKLIKRINDEENSIQELVAKVFYDLWFSEPVVRAPDQEAGELESRTQHMVEVLRGLSSHQPLVTIIQRSLMHDKASHQMKGCSTESGPTRFRCEQMCKVLLESILKAEESTIEQADTQALPYVSALHAFCTVDAALCSPSSDPARFVLTLQPYLKLQSGKDTAQLLQSICYIIDEVLPLIQRPPQSFVEELEKDLRSLVARHPYLLVNCQRCLFALGLLCRYGAEIIERTKVADCTLESIVKLFSFYLQHKDFNIKAKALQGLGSLCIARPAIFMRRTSMSIMRATLAERADATMKIQTLKILSDYLHDWEEKMGLALEEPGKEDDDVVFASRGPVSIAAGAGDSNACGGIVQLHWDSILRCCLDLKADVRQAALKVVEMALRHGLIHPMSSIPTLVAMEVDSVESNYKLAHQLLSQINDKYSDFFETRLGEGLQLSFAFLEGAGPSWSPMESHGVPSSGNNMSNEQSEQHLSKAVQGMSRVYKLISSSRISRNKLIYCSKVLASLPFCLPDEPLYLVHAANRLVQLRGGPLQAELKYMLVKGGPLEEAAGAAFEITPERAAERNEAHSEEEGAAASGSRLTLIEEPQLQDLGLEASCKVKHTILLQANCVYSAALSLLLLLKQHIKLAYGLTDARCQSYSPLEQIKQGETLFRREGSAAFSTITAVLEQPVTVRQAVRQCQVFMKLLEDDSGADFTYGGLPQRPRSSRQAVAKQVAHAQEEPSGGMEECATGIRPLPHQPVPARTSYRRQSAPLPGGLRVLSPEEDSEPGGQDSEYQAAEPQAKRQCKGGGTAEAAKQALLSCSSAYADATAEPRLDARSLATVGCALLPGLPHLAAPPHHRLGVCKLQKRAWQLR